MSTKIKTSTGWKTVADCGAAAPYSYSTNEQRTGGYWIDGKPIYRKVIRNIPLSTTWSNQTIDSSNQENLVSYKIIGHGSGTSAEILTTPYYNGVNDNFQVGLVVQSGGVECWCSATVLTEFDVILEYTKTTD